MLETRGLLVSVRLCCKAEREDVEDCVDGALACGDPLISYIRFLSVQSQCPNVLDMAGDKITPRGMKRTDNVVNSPIGKEKEKQVLGMIRRMPWNGESNQAKLWRICTI